MAVRHLGGSIDSMAGWFKYAYLLFVHLQLSIEQFFVLTKKCIVSLLDMSGLELRRSYQSFIPTRSSLLISCVLLELVVAVAAAAAAPSSLLS